MTSESKLYTTKDLTELERQVVIEYLEDLRQSISDEQEDTDLAVQISNLKRGW